MQSCRKSPTWDLADCDRYLRVKYGVLWTDLRNLHKPLRIGDVVILPGEVIHFLTALSLTWVSHWLLTWSRQLW